MSRPASSAAAIGDARRLAGYALAGARVVPAASGAEAVAAWESLADDVALLVLSPDVYSSLADRLEERPDLVWAVLPS